MKELCKKPNQKPVICIPGQHFLYIFPLLQGQGSLRPVLGEEAFAAGEPVWTGSLQELLPHEPGTVVEKGKDLIIADIPGIDT